MSYVFTEKKKAINRYEIKPCGSYSIMDSSDNLRTSQSCDDDGRTRLEIGKKHFVAEFNKSSGLCCIAIRLTGSNEHGKPPR
jgi:hypothetical protein